MTALKIKIDLHFAERVVYKLETTILKHGLIFGLLDFDQLHFSDVLIFLFFPIERLSFTSLNVFGRKRSNYFPLLHEVYIGEYLLDIFLFSQ